MKFRNDTIQAIISGTDNAPVEDLFSILDYMTGDSLFIHQYPRAQKICAADLRRQFPDPEQLATTKKLDVEPLAAGIWESRDPMEELIDILTKEAGGNHR